MQLLRKQFRKKLKEYKLSQLSQAAMKWEYRHIIAEKRETIPKFSKLDNIMSPFRLPELFFDDVLVVMIVGYTKLYSHRQEAGISFEITNEKIRLFLSMLLLRGCYKLPYREIYWETIPDTFVQVRSIHCLVMRLSLFFGASIFVTTNNV